MNKQKLQVLLTRLEKQLDSPQAARFNMRTFGSRYTTNTDGALPGFTPVCGTQACLAGETVLALNKAEIHFNGGIILFSDPLKELKESPSYGGQIEQAAAEELELTTAQKQRLFFFKNWTVLKRGWPDNFQHMYENAQTPQGRLYAAIRRVEHFIKTNGRQ